MVWLLREGVVSGAGVSTASVLVISVAVVVELARLLGVSIWYEDVASRTVIIRVVGRVVVDENVAH